MRPPPSQLRWRQLRRKPRSFSTESQRHGERHFRDGFLRGSVPPWLDGFSMATTIDSPVLTSDNAAAGSKGVQITQRALAKIRVAMAKENVSPEEGGLRLGVSGGGCSGLSYQI